MSFVLLLGISIYITFYNLNTMSCESILLPLLMERVGGEGNKVNYLYSLIPNFSLKG
jgi:hypothetical protein